MIREIHSDGLDAAIELVNRVFDEFVAPDFSEQGRLTFAGYMREKNQQYAADLDSGYRKMWGWFEGGRLCGVIALRGSSHIGLLFVDKPWQRQGIATALTEFLRRRLYASGIRRITVNASPYGVAFYRSAGFVSTGPMQEKDGIRFLPMECRMR